MSGEPESKTGWRIREPFSGLSHLVGALLSLVALIVLLIASGSRPLLLVGNTIYGVSLVVLYTASSLYHSLNASPRTQESLRRFDHSAIYGLIAGTFTPICLVELRGRVGWTLLLLEYLFAVAAVTLKIVWKRPPGWFHVVTCLVMGWLAVFALLPLSRSMPFSGLMWLVIGGLIYSIGAIIYATNRPRLWPGKFSAHDLWHVFVLCGSACHFIFIFYFITLRG